MAIHFRLQFLLQNFNISQNRMSGKENSQQFLLKSHKTLEKLQYKISDIAKTTNKNNHVLKTIKNATNQIQDHIEEKIEDNYHSMLNAQTIVNFDDNINKQEAQKKNGAKQLMENYWKSVSKSGKKNKQVVQDSLFPPLKQKDSLNEEIKGKKTAVISSLNVKLYEKQKQKESIRKFKEEKLMAYLYTYMVHVIDYKIQNDSTEFLMFQKSHYSKWDQIEEILKSIEHFCRFYQIKYCILDLQKILQLIENKSKIVKKETQKSKDKQKKNKNRNQGQKRQNQRKFTVHQLLGCLENAQEISAQNCKKKGIRFYGVKGKIRAIVKIQSAIRSKLAYETCKKIKLLIKKVVTIQRLYRIHLNYFRTKETIRNRCMQKYTWFLNRQKKFKSEFRLCELTKPLKYQIHISCHSISQWQRISTQNYIQKHNSEITRIFRAVANLSNETRIIYITPLPLPNDVLNYYYKLLELGGARDFQKKIIIFSPNQKIPFLEKCQLTRVLLYTSKVLKKVRSIIQNNYAYIVPSIPSIDYVALCHFLDVPLFCSQPQQLLFIQSKSGSKYLIDSVNKDSEHCSALPFATDIYSQQGFFNQLSNLIMKYPKIKKWVLKIDNQIDSRGVGYLDTRKLISKKLRKLIHQSNPAQGAFIFREIYQCLKYYFEENLSTSDKIYLLDRTIFLTQEEFLKNFYVNGGIIQAAIDDFKTEPTIISTSIVIQPDNLWKILCTYEKIVAKNKCIGCFYDKQDNNIEINRISEKIIAQLLKKQCFGFFTFDFIYSGNNTKKQFQSISMRSNIEIRDIKEEQKNYEFIGIKCYLDNLSSANFMRQFISKQSYTLYIPIISHNNIKRINMSTFFHLCRLQNLSFDIQNKIGNVFMFLDGMESGCMGLMTFNNKSKVQTFIHAAQVLDFFSNKISTHLSQYKQMFTLIRNAVNGYLNKAQRSKKTLAKKNLF